MLTWRPHSALHDALSLESAAPFALFRLKFKDPGAAKPSSAKVGRNRHERREAAGAETLAAPVCWASPGRGPTSARMRHLRSNTLRVTGHGHAFPRLRNSREGLLFLQGTRCLIQGLSSTAL